MKILVGIKRAVDYNVRIRVRNDGSGVETEGVKKNLTKNGMTANPITFAISRHVIFIISI